MDQSFKLSDGYRNWAAFVDEFRRIEESMQESKRVERLLVVRCNTLKSEIVESGKRLHTVMSVRAEDERTISLLRKECDLSAATSAEAKLKQKQAMALVSGLQADIGALQAQVGVLQSALWLERERANAAVKASRNAMSLTQKPNLSAVTKTATMDPTSPASKTAADAAAAAANVLEKSSTGKRAGAGRGGSLGQRRHVPPARRLGDAGLGAACRGQGPSSRRPVTASGAGTPLVSHQGFENVRAGGGAGGVCGGSTRGARGRLRGSKKNNSKNDDDCDFEALQDRAFGLDSLGSGAPSTTDALGLGGWATHGVDKYFHGGSGRDDDDQRGQRLQRFVLDLDGRCCSGFDSRRGRSGGGGRQTNEEGSGGGERDGADMTPFDRWKRDKGIFSPGVAEVFGARYCCA
ncbi:unnamed protein product [Hapterophycus canaliculatus]